MKLWALRRSMWDQTVLVFETCKNASFVCSRVDKGQERLIVSKNYYKGGGNRHLRLGKSISSCHD